MEEQKMPQMRMLLQDEQVRNEMIRLTPAQYQEGIEWIRKHFTFVYGQQIDWCHDPDAVIGKIQDLSEHELLHLLERYHVEPTRRLTVSWAYADTGIELPLSLIARHIYGIWLPVNDDVFLFDMNDTWCLELFHEGNFSCGSYEQKKE